MNPPTSATATRNGSTVTVSGNQTGTTSVNAVIELGTLTQTGFQYVAPFRHTAEFPADIELEHVFLDVPAAPTVTYCRISRQDNPATGIDIPINNANNDAGG